MLLQRDCKVWVPKGEGMLGNQLARALFFQKPRYYFDWFYIICDKVLGIFCASPARPPQGSAPPKREGGSRLGNQYHVSPRRKGGISCHNTAS